jgi:segregation and condensation protein B
MPKKKPGYAELAERVRELEETNEELGEELETARTQAERANNRLTAARVVLESDGGSDDEDEDDEDDDEEADDEEGDEDDDEDDEDDEDEDE